ncbi:quinone-dependent dihydroorotate dehydrogenase [uncultured Maricaulis sp.]|uniref:quinone-dependent dihydroorotate dehydrogenase n=1 Tax=uncultured Maricaulis sp. TaxID=174710 RepID=UPI00261DD2C1|nr:quinone-dependent dihydroorotate dehydrogenase [uncultured Maricaulis sp.]
MIHDLATRLLHGFDPETAHRLGVQGLKLGLGPRQFSRDPDILHTRLAGLDLPNPVGLAAGFDKNAEAPDALLAAGFGFVECGAVTPRAQDGKPKPRIFRLDEDKAVINRMGFPNQGLDLFQARLARRAGRKGVVGVNLGANLDSEDRVADYVACLTALQDLAQFFTVNVSSPNTPGLRTLQSSGALDDLLAAVAAVGAKAPVFLKIAPDIDDSEADVMVAAIRRHKLDGIIIANTTITRPESLVSDKMGEGGGLSGPPVFARSTELVRVFRKVAGPEMAIIGVGGVSCAETAYAKIRAGANAIQLYTGLIYEGPGLVQRIKRGLAERLQADGFASVAEAVGAE